MLEQLFRLKEKGTTPGTEVVAGLTTFLAMMYIIVVNPSILKETGMPFDAVLTATVLVSAFSSIAMGIFANNPIAVAPGMGINAFFTYTVVVGMKIPWETALGAVFWSGIVFLILSVLNIRTRIVKAIPHQIRYAVAAGIGLFITLIGFINSRFIVSDPINLLKAGKPDVITLTFLAGLLVTAVLVIKRVKGALIVGIALTTLLAAPIGRWWGDATAHYGSKTLVEWNGIFSMPDFSTLMQLDFTGSLQFAMIPVIFSLLFTDMFDSISTFIGVSHVAGLLDEEGNPENMKESLTVDSFSTIISSLFGTSSGTSYMESAAGVEEGGRSGLAAVVTGLMFIPFIFFSKLLSVIPAIATAPVLVLVGVFMLKPVTEINWNRMEDAFPAFVGMVLIPLTYSISTGITWGLFCWSAVRIMRGKFSEVPPVLLMINIITVGGLFL